MENKTKKASFSREKLLFVVRAERFSPRGRESEREVKRFERGVLFVLLTEQDLTLYCGPVDAESWVVIKQSALVGGGIQAGAFVGEGRRFGEHEEAVGKALGNVELALVFAREEHALPFAEGLAVAAQIDGDVKDLARKHAHELALRT